MISSIRKVLLRTRVPKQFIRPVSNVKYKLEISYPLDTAETNMLMRNDHIPNLKAITPEQAYTGLVKSIANYDYEYEQLVVKLVDDLKSRQITFEDFFVPFEQHFVTLQNAIRTATYLGFTNPYSKYHSVFIINTKMCGIIENNLWGDERLFEILKGIQSNKQPLSPSHKRLLDYYINQVGIYCSGNLNGNDIEYYQSSLFEKSLEVTSDRLKHTITDPKQIEHLPENERNKILGKNTKGPWIVPCSSIPAILKYSDDRDLRKSLYDKYYLRSGATDKIINQVPDSTNAFIIDKIRDARQLQASTFGLKDYATYCAAKSTVDLPYVLEVIEKVRAELKPISMEELERLQQYSAELGNTKELMGHDMDYYVNKHTCEHYKNLASIDEYFPEQKVLDGLLKFTSNLFNVKFKEDKTDSYKFDEFCQRNTIYNIYDENDNFLSILVLVPYSKVKGISSAKKEVFIGGGPYAFKMRGSSSIGNSKPVYFFHLDQRPEHLTSMTFAQVEQLFANFGGCMDNLIHDTEFLDYKPDQTPLARIRQHITSGLLKKLLMVPEVMKSIGSHKVTGKPVPDELLEQLKNKQSNFRIFDLMQQLFKISLDLECHLKRNDHRGWETIQDEIWPLFMPYEKEDSYSIMCQMVELFTIKKPHFGAELYSNLFNEIALEDIFKAFREVGLETDQQLQRVGYLYRKNFMIPGCSVKFSEAFLKFRGREMSLKPFIDQVKEDIKKSRNLRRQITT